MPKDRDPGKKQTQRWASEFGTEYTDRNLMSLESADALYLDRYGVSRTELNQRFLGDLPRDIRILEVGSNVGVQLVSLQQMGFTNLYGIDVSAYAVELSKAHTKNINVIQGDALDIPFKDGFFDLVFTSGALIHIQPANLHRAMAEILRCAKQYIWGLEYYASVYTPIKYRGEDNLLWKANFPRLFMEHRDGEGLTLVRSEVLKYTCDQNEDIMYLLERRLEQR